MRLIKQDEMFRKIFRFTNRQKAMNLLEMFIYSQSACIEWQMFEAI